MEPLLHSLRLSSPCVAVTGMVCIFQLAGEVGVEPIDTTVKNRGARPFIVASWQNPSFFPEENNLCESTVGDLTPFSPWSVTSTLSCPFLERNSVHDILQKGNGKTNCVSLWLEMNGIHVTYISEDLPYT